MRSGGVWTQPAEVEVPLASVITPAAGRTITGKAFKRPGALRLLLNVAGHVDNTRIGDTTAGHRPTTQWFGQINGGSGTGQARFATAGEVWGFGPSGVIQVSASYPLP